MDGWLIACVIMGFVMILHFFWKHNSENELQRTYAWGGLILGIILVGAGLYKVVEYFLR